MTYDSVFQIILGNIHIIIQVKHFKAIISLTKAIANQKILILRLSILVEKCNKFYLLTITSIITFIAIDDAGTLHVYYHVYYHLIRTDYFVYNIVSPFYK